MMAVFRSLCEKFPVAVAILLTLCGLFGLGVAIANLFIGVPIVAGVFCLSVLALGGMQQSVDL